MYQFSPTHGERFYNMPDAKIWFERREIVLTDQQEASVTTALSVWPKGEEFQRWMASKETYEDAIEERNKGGRRGTRVHKGIEAISRGEVLNFYEFRDTYHKGVDIAAYDEWRRLESFAEWHRDYGYPTIINRVTGKPALECTLYSWMYGFAGTTDIVVTGGHFGNAQVMIDFKTGKSIYLSFWAQLAAYRKAWHEMKENGQIDGIGILLFGGLGRKAYSFEYCQSEEEMEAFFLDFLAAQRIWRRENQKSSLRSGERTWGEVKSARTVYDVTDYLTLEQPIMEKGVSVGDEEETPAWAQRPVKQLPMNPLPETAKDMQKQLTSAIGKEVSDPPTKRRKIIIS